MILRQLKSSLKGDAPNVILLIPPFRAEPTGTGVWVYPRDTEKGAGWLSDEDARLIFLHLVVHLEPQIKTAVQAKKIEPKENWKTLICLVGGFSTLALLVATVVLGHNKALRRKWFKGHRYFATATLISAIIHGAYCYYIFDLD